MDMGMNGEEICDGLSYGNESCSIYIYIYDFF